MPFNADDFVYFVLINPRKAAYTTNGYVDSEGNDRYVVDKYNSDGTEKRYRFKFSRGKRKIWFHKTKEEHINFLKNHPDCEGSPNSTGYPVFKMIDEESDAKLAIDYSLKRKEAEDLALSLKGSDLDEVAVLCGSSATSETKKKFHVLSFAENRPDEFVEMVSSPERMARATFKKALRMNVLKRKGFILMWGDQALGHGGDENNIIDKLLKDKKLLEALKEDVERASKSK